MKYKVTENTTILEFLFKLFPESPKTRVKKMLSSGKISINGKSVTHFATQLKPGDEINSTSFINKKKDLAPFKILFEDEYFVAVDKIPGINTSSADNSPSCVAMLADWYMENSKKPARIYVVHRIDKEVSGVLLFSKSEEITEYMRDNWDKTKKKYIAVTEGTPPQKHGFIESWLIEKDNQKMYSLKEMADGAKYAKTEYVILKTIDNYSVLEITLHTGRKNQIRVHMKDIGCPIAGDRKYGADSRYERRIRLHSAYLSFPHPVTGEQIEITSNPPEMFYKINSKNEKYK